MVMSGKVIKGILAMLCNYSAFRLSKQNAE